ncbi:hypothetical protein IMCC3135_10150 [Granulosicoccus antarcticus IMCC3135]|uniref:Uncharacterized protein n=2 Tax=Granulosicoccus TaxID=437504 RepID=A0A2Z2NY95_9GAMM|nr:hypothetical protein IMCC3135_10150 [Granulosicoccus antarcticus IMCC3135]
MPFGLYDEGEYSWDHVTLGIFVPWWLVSIEVDLDGDGTWRQTQMLKHVQQIVSLESESNVTLRRVQQISPHFENNHGWEMIDVKKIVLCNNGNNIAKEPVEFIQYELTNGEIITIPEDITSIENVIKIIYSFE